MKNTFLLFFLFIFLSCSNRVDIEQDAIIRKQAEKIKQLEERINELEETQMSHKVGKDRQKIKFSQPEVSPDSDRFFTIGSTEEEVLEIQGTPSGIIDVGPYKTFSYGLSSVQFSNGKVQGYHNTDRNLKIKVTH